MPTPTDVEWTVLPVTCSGSFEKELFGSNWISIRIFSFNGTYSGVSRNIPQAPISRTLPFTTLPRRFLTRTVTFAWVSGQAWLRVQIRLLLIRIETSSKKCFLLLVCPVVFVKDAGFARQSGFAAALIVKLPEDEAVDASAVEQTHMAVPREFVIVRPLAEAAGILGYDIL